MRLSRIRLMPTTRLSGAAAISFLFRDEFTTARAAGSVHNTAAEPGPGTRTIVDTQSKLALDGSNLVFRKPTSASWGIARFTLGTQTRAAGLTIFSRNFRLSSVSGLTIGWSDATTGMGKGIGIYSIANELHGYFAITSGASNEQYFSTLAYGTPATFAVVSRMYGGHIFQLVGTNWLLVCSCDNVGTQATLYPCVSNNNTESSVESVRVINIGWVPSPVVSDSFDRANNASSLGLTDGLGHLDNATAPGGSGLAWTANTGTWGIQNNRTAITTSGGKAIATVESSLTDVYLQAETLRQTGGVVGVIVRFVDTSNYVYACFDGTNLLLRKVLAGVESDVASIAAAQNGYTMMYLAAIGTRFVVGYYNGVGLDATITDAALQTGTRVGMYAMANDAIIRGEFVAFPVGSDGRYNYKFSQYVTNPTSSHTFLAVGDSKTAGATRYPNWLTNDTTMFVECLPRIATAGISTSGTKDIIDAALASVVGTPEFVTYNLGINDIGANAGTWQTNTLYILDAIHTAYPSAKVYMSYVWKNGSDADCDTIDGWIATATAARSTFVFTGPDERVYLKGSDNGATMTSDGTHPNILGTVEAAKQWRAVMGF